MKKMGGYPRWFPWVLICLLAGLFISGGLLLPTLLDMRLEWDVIWRLGGSQRIAVAALHVGLGFILLAALGALAVIHMRLGWRRRQNRFSGALLPVLIMGLTLTGLGIFYFGDDDLSLLASVSHTAIGLTLELMFIQHVLNGYRLRAAIAHLTQGPPSSHPQTKLTDRRFYTYQRPH